MKKALMVSASVFLPFFTFAQTNTTPDLGNINSLALAIGKVISTLIPIVFALALLYFFWGLAQYILSAGDSAKQEEGRNKMIWGIVALFVMAAVWGLVRFLGTAIGITPGQGAPDINSLIPKTTP